MNNKVTSLQIAVLLALCVALAGCKSSSPDSVVVPSDASPQFKAKRPSCFRPQEALVLYPQLKVGMTKQQVLAFLGKPDDHTALKSTADRWNYTVGYSQAFTLEFEDRLVKKSQVGLDAKERPTTEFTRFKIAAPF